MEKSYWNEAGKHQAFCDIALDKAPSFGYTSNIYLNSLIAMSHLYYDAYNNGGCNIEDVYQRDFNTYVKPLFPNFDILDFIYGNEMKMEQTMDRLLEYLQDKPLDYEVYSIWWSYNDKVLTRVEPTDKSGPEFSPVTFGNPETLNRWCAEQIAFCHVKDITDEVTLKNKAIEEASLGKESVLPELCYSVLQTTGQVIALQKGESGYYPTAYGGSNREENQLLVVDLNKKLGLTKAQVMAMEFGSMFGWDKPGANPRVYEKLSLQEKITKAEEKGAGQTNLGTARAPVAQQR